MATSNDGGYITPTNTNTASQRTPRVGISDDASQSPHSTSGRLRSASLRFLESSPPSGMWHATGTVLAQAPTPMDLRRGSFGPAGWDGERQRRHSSVSEESAQRISRQSTAQSPVTRSHANTLESHAEANDEVTGFSQPGGSKEPSSQTKSRFAKQSAPSGPIDDDDDPFSKFIGRGRIDDQSFVPRNRKSSPKTIDPVADIDEEEEDASDSLDELDPRPKKRRSALPKKFLDGNEKAPVTTTGPLRPPSPFSTPNTEKVLPPGPDANGVYPNGYKFPPEHTWGQATVIGLKAFWKFTITPLGFLIVIYGLNVVAWGGMLFLLLIGGGKEYMCYPPGSHGVKECNNIDSPRRIWIEIDSQILNALFCVTGFGLIPWRFRDLYYLLKYRLGKEGYALRKLAGIHRSWFRLPDSDALPASPTATIPSPDTNPAVPLPVTKIPDPPLTGYRAPPTALWKLDYVIWAYVLNTFLQAVLSGFMWGFNRYTRPSWSTGLFVALACIVAGLGGLMCFFEGKRIKKVEGIPVEEAQKLADVERGVVA